MSASTKGIKADETGRLNALLERGWQSLGVEASREAKERLQARLLTLAAELVLEWIVGERRFESQSQQTEYWLARVFEEILPDEQPEATRIYTRFGFPLPRSQYLARLLLARRAARWREAARREVLVRHRNADPPWTKPVALSAGCRRRGWRFLWCERARVLGPVDKPITVGPRSAPAVSGPLPQQ